jgi:hypothetical protein
MVILREIIESDLATTLEGDFGLPVVLIGPDGVTYDTSFNDPSTPLLGQILYDTRVDIPETGQEIIVHKPVVTLRRTSLERIPISGEKWIVKIPIVPQFDAPKVSFSLENPTEDGGAIGFIRLYLMELEQS